MSKISIIGAGAVGSITALVLSECSWINEIVIVDINQDKATGEVLDILHGISLTQNILVKAGNYSDTKNSDVIIITVGVPEKIGENRLVPLQKNIKILQDIIPKFLKYNSTSKILVVSNPVDILSYVTYKISELPFNQVIGLGTILDMTRFQYLISKDFGVAPEAVNASVVGEHGDSQVLLWSKLRIGDLTFEEAASEFGVDISGKYCDNLFEKVKDSAFEVWKLKKYTAFSAAFAIKKVVKAIIRDENIILPVSSISNIQKEEIFISQPCIINNRGINKVLNIHGSDSENKKFEYAKIKLNNLKSIYLV